MASSFSFTSFTPLSPSPLSQPTPPPPHQPFPSTHLSSHTFHTPAAAAAAAAAAATAQAAVMSYVSLPSQALAFPSIAPTKPCTPLFARRKTSADNASSEDDQLDLDLRTGLNEMTTEAVKVMLSGRGMLVEEFKEKVEYTRQFLVDEGHSEAAKFAVVIQGMLHHKVIPEKDELKGAYKKAFEKVWAVLEDSGWLLTLPSGTSAVEMIDEELIPPILETQY